MGVADGVYMWKELGIDSGTMARTLMETCQHMVAAGCEDVYKSEWLPLLHPPLLRSGSSVQPVARNMASDWHDSLWCCPTTSVRRCFFCLALGATC